MDQNKERNYLKLDDKLQLFWFSDLLETSGTKNIVRSIITDLQLATASDFRPSGSACITIDNLSLP